MTHYKPYDDVAIEPRPERNPIRRAIHSLVSVAVRTLELLFANLDRMERWLTAVDWRPADSLFCDLVGFGLCIVAIYVAWMIGYAVYFVSNTPGGHALTGGR